MSNYKRESSSFRDPSGFVFYNGNVLFRQINKSYKENYDHLMNSGLYEQLVNSKFLIPHEETDISPFDNNAYKIIKPEQISFISYPYEWSFNQLKHAALTTIEIQKISMEYGMTLKDCSAYNIQFKECNPVLIDTLSFEKYEEGQIWKAYQQFCQHFLAPLALMTHKDIRLNQLLKIYIDGIPLDLASSLLPMRTHTMFSLLTHIHAHAKSQKRYGDKKVKFSKRKLPKNSFLGLIDSLHSAIKKLTWSPKGTEWANYYFDTNYSEKSFEQKKKIISDWLEEIKPKFAWDLGSNTGIFSRIAASKGIETISFDIDSAAVEQNFLNAQKNNEKYILPLLLDLTNPSPSIGWENQERKSFADRGPVEIVMALALIHHLAISNNLPLSNIATFFQKICKHLIIEFIPKTDSQISRLLVTREDIFDDYSKEKFEEEFKNFFIIHKKIELDDSERILYLMEKKRD